MNEVGFSLGLLSLFLSSLPSFSSLLFKLFETSILSSPPFSSLFRFLCVCVYLSLSSLLAWRVLLGC